MQTPPECPRKASLGRTNVARGCIPEQGTPRRRSCMAQCVCKIKPPAAVYGVLSANYKRKTTLLRAVYTYRSRCAQELALTEIII